MGTLHRRTGDQPSLVSQRAAQRGLEPRDGGRLRAFWIEFLLLQFTETLLNYPAYQAGMVLMPRAVAMLLTMPVVGRLYNFVSPRILIAVGILALVMGYWNLSHFTLTVSFANFLPILAMTGIGMGASMVTMSTVSLSTVARSQMTGASSLFTLSRRVSGNIAYAMLATMLARCSQVHRSELVGGVSGTNPLFRSTDAQFRGVLSGTESRQRPAADRTSRSSARLSTIRQR